MSGFWDALVRAASGLPGSAEPKPRSMFEDYGTPMPAEIAETADAHDTEAVEPDGGADAPRARPPRRVADEAMPAVPQQPPREHSLRRPPASPETPFDPLYSLPGDVDQAPAHPRSLKVSPEPAARDATAIPDPMRQAPASSFPGNAKVLPPAGPPQPTAVAAVAALSEPELAPNAAGTASARDPAPARSSGPDGSGEAGSAPTSEPAIAVAVAVAELPATHALAETPEPPPLVIEIGRIEIRIASEAAPAPAAPARQRRAAVLAPSLADYLDHRGKAAR